MIDANLSSKERRAIYERDGFRCALCDCATTIQIHHYVPRGQNGSDHPHNLITLCSYCHSHAHGRPLYETPFTQEDIELAIVEYLSDMYAGEWDPYRR